MAKGIRFEVWKGGGGLHYAHMIAGNNKITWQSEGYTDARNAHKVCSSTWTAIRNTVKDQTPLVPYTKNSLKP